MFPAIFLILLTLAVTATAAPPKSRETVILVHGLGRSSLSMIPLAWTLERAGYHVVNLHYPSHRGTVEQLSEDYLAKAVASETASGATRIHFVTHSLGGILVRQYLATHTVAHHGRVVMLAPPNHGSKWVDSLKKTFLGRWILGPAGRELGTAAADLPERLGPAQFPVGIIAAKHDSKVPPDNAKLAGMSDFLIVPGFHTWIMCRADTSRATLAFLATGHFPPRPSAYSSHLSPR